MVSVGGRKLQNRLPRGHFLFSCSDTFAVGCIVYSHNAERHRQTDRQTTLS